MLVDPAAPARLPQLRGGRGRARARADRRARAQRRRQDEPARGAVLRLHRPLVPHDQRARGRALRGAGGARRGATARPRTARPRARGRASSRASRSACGSTARRSSGCIDAPARPLVSVFLPDRLELVKGPPALRRVAPRPGRRRAVAGARGDAPRVRAGARPAQRAARPGPRRPRVARVAAGVGRSSSRATASRCATTAPRRSSCSPRRFAAAAGELGLAGEAELRYRPRSTAPDAEALAAELAERVDGDLERGFTGHGPHRDDLRPGARRARAARLRLAGRAAPGPAGAAAGRARGARGRARRAAPAAARRRHERARRGRRGLPRRAARRARAGVVTTTDLAHVPGADTAGRDAAARRRGNRARRGRRGRSRHEAAAAPPVPWPAPSARWPSACGRPTGLAAVQASGRTRSAPRSPARHAPSRSATGTSRWPARRPSGRRRSTSWAPRCAQRSTRRSATSGCSALRATREPGETVIEAARHFVPFAGLSARCEQAR